MYKIIPFYNLDEEYGHIQYIVSINESSLRYYFAHLEVLFLATISRYYVKVLHAL